MSDEVVELRYRSDCLGLGCMLVMVVVPFLLLSCLLANVAQVGLFSFSPELQAAAVLVLASAGFALPLAAHQGKALRRATRLRADPTGVELDRLGGRLRLSWDEVERIELLADEPYLVIQPLDPEGVLGRLPALVRIYVLVGALAPPWKVLKAGVEPSLVERLEALRQRHTSR